MHIHEHIAYALTACQWIVWCWSETSSQSKPLCSRLYHYGHKLHTAGPSLTLKLGSQSTLYTLQLSNLVLPVNAELAVTLVDTQCHGI